MSKLYYYKTAGFDTVNLIRDLYNAQFDKASNHTIMLKSLNKKSRNSLPKIGITVQGIIL